jgi:hypothetical protein
MTCDSLAYRLMRRALGLYGQAVTTESLEGWPRWMRGIASAVGVVEYARDVVWL